MDSSIQITVDQTQANTSPHSPSSPYQFVPDTEVDPTSDFSSKALRALIPEIDCSRDTLRAFVPNREDTIANCANRYLRNIIDAAKKGRYSTTLYHEQNKHFAEYDPIDTKSVTHEELVAYLVSKCKDCSVTWKPYEWPHDKGDWIEITVCW